jgi:hypothetical protein
MRKPKHHHSDRDRIMTPESLAIKLIGRIPYEKDDSWCDPCLGTGVFYNNFPTENKEWFEIDRGKDFLNADDKWDWVVTNIPFSQPNDFIFKMAETCIKGFGILCLANSMTATRINKLAKMGLYISSVDVLYVREWGFGYRTDFYVFTRQPVSNINFYFTPTKGER